MTQLPRTAVIRNWLAPRCESPRIWHYGLRALYKQGQCVQFTSPRLLGEVGGRALRSFRVREKTPRPFMDAGRPQNARHPNPLPQAERGSIPGL
jgi:hypothetical protein